MLLGVRQQCQPVPVSRPDDEKMRVEDVRFRVVFHRLTVRRDDASAGLFDLLASAQAAFGTGDWVAYYMETYIFVALIYWAFISSLGRYGEYLKDRMSQEEH